MRKHEILQLKSDIICWNLSACFTDGLEKGISKLEKYILKKKSWNFF